MNNAKVVGRPGTVDRTSLVAYRLAASNLPRSAIVEILRGSTVLARSAGVQ